MPERYRLSVAASARRDFDRLPEAVAGAVAELLTGDLLQNPHRLGKALRPPYEGVYSARRGTFRVLYRILEEQQIVQVNAIRHRRDAYR